MICCYALIGLVMEGEEADDSDTAGSPSRIPSRVQYFFASIPSGGCTFVDSAHQLLPRQNRVLRSYSPCPILLQSVLSVVPPLSVYDLIIALRVSSLASLYIVENSFWRAASPPAF
jgi:hypothetical protein